MEKKKKLMFLLKNHVVKTLQVKSSALDRKVSRSFELPLVVAVLFALMPYVVVKGIFFREPWDHGNSTVLAEVYERTSSMWSKAAF